jgi:hypothetical protein
VIDLSIIADASPGVDRSPAAEADGNTFAAED